VIQLYSFALDFQVEILFSLLKYLVSILLSILLQIYRKMLIMALDVIFSTHP